MCLIDNLMDMGRTVLQHKWYSLPKFYLKLYKRRTNACGTVGTNCADIPKSCISNLAIHEYFQNMGMVLMDQVIETYQSHNTYKKICFIHVLLPLTTVSSTEKTLHNGIKNTYLNLFQVSCYI